MNARRWPFVVTILLCLTIKAWAGISVAFPGPGLTNAGTVAIGTPISIGTKTQTGGTTIAITTTANAPAGSVIVVGCITNVDFVTVAITDGTNTYTTAVNQANTNVLSNTGILGAQLNSGSTITVTGSTTIADGFCAAAYVTGLSTATPDKVASASSNTTTTAALTQANEIVFGMALAFNGGVAPGAVTMTSGFTILGAATNYGADNFSGSLAYKIVAATTAVTFSWSATLTASQSVAVSYKGN